MAETLAAMFVSEGTAITASGAAASAAGAVAGAGLDAVAGAYTGALASVSSVASTIGSVGSILSGGFSVLSALNHGSAQASADRAQAAQYQLQANQETIRGMQESNIIKQRTLRALASNNARAGAAGVDISSGSIRDVQGEIMRQSDQQLSITRADSNLSALTRTMSAAQKEIDANYDFQAGLTLAGSNLFENSAARVARGGSYQAD